MTEKLFDKPQILGLILVIIGLLASQAVDTSIGAFLVTLGGGCIVFGALEQLQ